MMGGRCHKNLEGTGSYEKELKFTDYERYDIKKIKWKWLSEGING